MLHATSLTYYIFSVWCSDSIRLQQQLEELQIKLVSLEKKTADYEFVQAELKEKKVCAFSVEYHSD